MHARDRTRPTQPPNADTIDLFFFLVREKGGSSAPSEPPLATCLARMKSAPFLDALRAARDFAFSPRPDETQTGRPRPIGRWDVLDFLSLEGVLVWVGVVTSLFLAQQGSSTGAL